MILRLDNDSDYLQNVYTFYKYVDDPKINEYEFHLQAIEIKTIHRNYLFFITLFH